jgi:hypothetical protein
MLPYPPPAPFSPTQEDLDRLAASLLQSYREKAERERRSAEEQARKDAELRRAGDLTAWDESYCFRHRFRKFFSDPRLDVKHVFWGSLIAAVVIPFRLLCLPFQLAALIIRLPMRPARGAPPEGTSSADATGAAQPITFPPLRLEVSQIRTFDKLASIVAAYDQNLQGGNAWEDDRTPEQKRIAEQHDEEQLLGRCAQISHRLVDHERYAPLKRSASRDAGNNRRRIHCQDRCGATFKLQRINTRFISPTLTYQERVKRAAASSRLEREALFTQWAKSVTLGEGLCPSVFRYEYHSPDGKPHTVRILFDLARRTLRITRFEVRHLQRSCSSPEDDYQPDEEIGSFERRPAEKLWREFLDYLVNHRFDQCPISLNEQAVRPVSWTLDVEFGDYEVHVGDSQTGPIGDKLSLMVGRLIV